MLEAGASAFAIDWTLVQQEVARTNRVCSYDRAGSGWSDPSTPETRATVMHDLHSLLQVAGEAPPYVMVGASLGGIYVRLYAAKYSDQVAGMMLVDPASEEPPAERSTLRGRHSKALETALRERTFELASHCAVGFASRKSAPLEENP